MWSVTHTNSSVSVLRSHSFKHGISWTYNRSRSSLRTACTHGRVPVRQFTGTVVSAPRNQQPPLPARTLLKSCECTISRASPPITTLSHTRSLLSWHVVSSLRPVTGEKKAEFTTRG